MLLVSLLYLSTPRAEMQGVLQGWQHQAGAAGSPGPACRSPRSSACGGSTCVTGRAASSCASVRLQSAGPGRPAASPAALPCKMCACMSRIGQQRCGAAASCLLSRTLALDSTCAADLLATSGACMVMLSEARLMRHRPSQQRGLACNKSNMYFQTGQKRTVV